MGLYLQVRLGLVGKAQVAACSVLSPGKVHGVPVLPWVTD